MRRNFTRTVGVNRPKKHLIRTKDGKIEEIRTHQDRPIWVLVKEYINSLLINQEFTRTQLLRAVYTTQANGFSASIDCYIGYLKIFGFLSGNGKGTYKKLYNIPEKLTTTALVRAACDQSWKKWFVPLYERLGIDEQDAPKQ